MKQHQLKTLIVLFKTYQHILNHVKKSLLDSDLSINEFTAMEALYHKGRLTTQQLASSILIPNSSLTYVLDCLEKKSLVRRQKNVGDGRITDVELTKQGNEVFAKVYEHHYERLRPIFDILLPEQELELQESLKILGKYAQEEL